MKDLDHQIVIELMEKLGIKTISLSPPVGGSTPVVSRYSLNIKIDSFGYMSIVALISKLVSNYAKTKPDLTCTSFGCVQNIDTFEVFIEDETY